MFFFFLLPSRFHFLSTRPMAFLLPEAKMHLRLLDAILVRYVNIEMINEAKIVLYRYRLRPH